MSHFGSFRVSQSNSDTFVNTNLNDIIISANELSQTIHIGHNGMQKPSMSITSNNILVSASILPQSNVAYDLGSSNMRFRDIWLSGNTIHVGETSISRDDTSGAVKIVDSVSQGLQRLIVKEMQIGGESNDSSSLVIRKDPQTGKVEYAVAPLDSNGVAQLEDQSVSFQNLDEVAASNVLPGSFQSSTYTFPSHVNVGTLSIGNFPIANVESSDNSYISASNQINILTHTNKQLLTGAASHLWTAYIDSVNGARTMKAITCDSAGNIYISGQYTQSGNVLYSKNGTASSVTLPTPLASSSAVFIAKYSPDGEPLWATAIDSPGADSGESIMCDPLGNVYLAGFYTGSASIVDANGVTSGITIRSPTSQGVFVVKFSSSGVAQWAGSIDGSSTDNIFNVCVDSGGNVFVGGNYSLVATVYSAGNASAFNLRTSTNIAGFIVKYNTSGVAQWSVTMDSTVNVNSTETVRSIVVDSNNNIYVCGTVTGSAQLVLYNTTSTNTITSRSFTNGAGFLAKYSSVGEPLWVSIINSPSTTSETAVCISLYGQDVLNIIGQVFNGTRFYNADGSDSNIVVGYNGTSQGAFIAKYNSNGQALMAATMYGLTHPPLPFSIVSDSQGNTYTVVLAQNRYVFYDANSTIASDIMSIKGWVPSHTLFFKHNNQGVVQWCLPIETNAICRSMYLYNNNQLYLSYDFVGTAIVFPYVQATRGTNVAQAFASVGSQNAVALTKFNVDQSIMIPYVYELPTLTNTYNGCIKYIVNNTSNSDFVHLKYISSTDVVTRSQISPRACRVFMWLSGGWIDIQ